jgi:hypothetical protein
MCVAIVDRAIEYHGRFLELKKYSSAELSAFTLPLRATIIIKEK